MVEIEKKKKIKLELYYVVKKISFWYLPLWLVYINIIIVGLFFVYSLNDYNPDVIQMIASVLHLSVIENIFIIAYMDIKYNKKLKELR